jgi:predicted patatin/cPLA2 family phospholipase
LLIVKNAGVVSDQDVMTDHEKWSKYLCGRNALVAQGGGQRGIFTAGVLDAFNLSNFDPFDVYYGTSAGALNLCPFLCRQPELGKAFITELTTASSFFNLFSYIRKKQYVDLDWALDCIVDYPYRLDLDMGRQVLGQRQAYAAVTRTDLLIDNYLPLLHVDWRKVLLATCAIPTLCPQPIDIAGELYVDGGISASIPVQEAWRQGARFIAVIRTESVTPQEAISENYFQFGRRRSPENVRYPLDSLDASQSKWQQKLVQWRQNWSEYLHQKAYLSSQGDVLNGGRWLFGADNLYRMSDLIGNRLDTALVDMLMVHYQTYALTLEFLKQPPDDTFIVQIAPSKPLKSNTLLSRKSDLLDDYERGLEAGYRFIQSWESVCRQSGLSLNTLKSGLFDPVDCKEKGI